jgi:CDP-glucose 4,6-dehydratase
MEDVVIDPSFWIGRRVFVTGNTGFKGSWMSLMLARLHADVTGYALAPPLGPSLFELATVERESSHTTADVTDLVRLTAEMQRTRPEIVFHLAAQPLVKAGYADPVGTYHTNVMGTVNVLEAVRHTPEVRTVIIITTDKCYENRDWIWGYRETDRLGGFDPYSNSKACAELVASAFRDSYFTRPNVDTAPITVVTARAGNVIGGGDFAQDRIIPDAIRAFAAGKTLAVRNPAAVRPWQHVLDPLGGYLMLAEHAFNSDGKLANAWNFGPMQGDERPVEAVVDKICSGWGGMARWARDTAAHAHEARLLRLDSSQAREVLAWTPVHDFDSMIDTTVDWYRAHADGADMALFTRGQVDRYLLSRIRLTGAMPAAIIEDKQHATG